MTTVIQFPAVSSQFVDPETGRIQQAWLQFLITLWNRTGGSTGSTGDDTTALALALDTPQDPVDIDEPKLLALLGDPPDPVDVAFLEGLALGLLADTPKELSVSPISTETVGASPWTYTAGFDGHLLVVGGTVSQIDLIRGNTFTTGLTAGFIPLAPGDQCKITYAVAPTVYFVPSGKDNQ